MAKDRKADAPKKRHWWNYMAEAYRVTKRSYTWLPWALIGGALAGLAVGLIPAFLTKSWITWTILGIFLMTLIPMLLLANLVRRASYAQLDGMTGAASAVIENIGRGWDVKSEPVRLNPRTQDMVFRAIGRAGVVLVAEGPKNRVRSLVEDERKAIKRVAPNAPINVVFVGRGEGQVPLAKVERTIRKFPKHISNAEVAALARRLEAIGSNAIGIPKGIDPTKTRVSRRALRG